MIKKRIRDILSAEWYVFKLLFSVNIPSGILYIVLRSLFYPVSLINTFIWKFVIDEITVVFSASSFTFRLWILLGIYIGINTVNSIVVSYVLTVLANDIRNQAQNKLELQVMRKVAALSSSYFDNPQNRDVLDSAKHSKERVSGAITFMVSECLSIATFVVGFVLFVQINPIVSLVFLLTSIPAMVINYKYDVQMNKHSIQSIPEARKKDYYRSLLTEKYAAKDVRLYNLSGFFKEKYNTLWKHIRKQREQIFMRGAKHTYLAMILSTGGKLFLVLFSVISILRGKMSLGTLSMFLALSQQISGRFMAIMRSIPNHLKNEIPHIQNFRDFLTHSDDAMPTSDPESLDISIAPEIEFRDVCFRYPGALVNAIDHLNLFIPAGKKIALIGVNGAGKSTVIKLLLRLYEPQSGQILINGTDVCLYPVDQLHRVFGVCFQNVPQYALTMRENIALSRLDELHDDVRLNAAAQAAGIYNTCSAFQSGMDTNLTRKFDDQGQEMSGGEWQKVGIARAFFRDSPFVILDEPSSALDPQAEDDLFSAFHHLCQGRGGILVSHRLSAMMMVDEIVLLQSGHVMEQGTHEHLMRQNGEYAKLYRMQAENFVGKGAI